MNPDDEIQLVTFRIGVQVFAFTVFEVERVLRYEAPTPVPKAPAFLEGMLPYGGEVVPIVDLRTRLGSPDEVHPETRTIVLEWEQGKIGVVVDAVLELFKVPAGDVKPPPPLVQGLAAEYINGVFARDGRPVIILATSKLLSSTERLELAAAAAEATGE